MQCVGEVSFEVLTAVIIQTDTLQSGTNVFTLHGNLMEPARCSETSVYFYQILRRHVVHNSFMQVRDPMQVTKEIGGVQV